MAQKVVSFHYTLTNQSGEQLDTSEGGQPFSYIEGMGQIIPGLENALSALKDGDAKKITVPAADAYGEKDDSYVVRVKKEQLPAKDVKLGDKFRGGPDNDSPVFVVKELTDSEAVLDGNHPLAGQDLTFDVKMVSSREATAEEISHGHAHGEHGHAH